MTTNQIAIAACRRLLYAAVVWATFVAGRAQAVSVVSGNGNNDGASLATYGGPGGAGGVSEPGFVSVGRTSTGNASATYIGSRWVLTAAHNSIGTTVSFGATTYNIDAGTITTLDNPDSSPTDLVMFRITADPGLPEITPDLISSTAATGHQFMIGNGKNVTGQQFWHDDGVTDPWPADATPGSVDPDDYSGFGLLGRIIGWGENEVTASGVITIGSDDVHVFVTQFDDPDYTGTASLTHEAQGSSGDSGGATFGFVDGQWKLTGIILAVSSPRPRQPDPSIAFGDFTFVADLSVYRDQIIAIVPEPGGLILGAMATLAVGLCGLGRRRNRPRRPF